MTPSTLTGRWWRYPGTLVYLQDHHGAFRLIPAAANRINTASSPHTPGLGLQPSRLMPRLPLHLSGSNWPKISSILGSHRGRVYTRFPFVQQTRERPWSEGWELRSSPGPAGILWLEMAVSTTAYAPLHMDKICQSSIQVLHPACKVTAVHSQTSPESILPKQREQVGSTGHSYMYLASPPGATLARWASPWTPLALILLLLPAGPNHSAHTAYTGVAST